MTAGVWLHAEIIHDIHEEPKEAVEQQREPLSKSHPLGWFVSSLGLVVNAIATSSDILRGPSTRQSWLQTEIHDHELDEQ